MSEALRSVRADGYVMVKMPEHPRSNRWGFVYEHILVAEKKIGRPLVGDELVHHADHSPSNNSPENLMVLADQNAHMKQHAIERAAATGADHGITKKCGSCLEIKPVSMFSPNISRGVKLLQGKCKTCRSKEASARYHSRRPS